MGNAASRLDNIFADGSNAWEPPDATLRPAARVEEPPDVILRSSCSHPRLIGRSGSSRSLLGGVTYTRNAEIHQGPAQQVKLDRHQRPQGPCHLYPSPPPS